MWSGPVSAPPTRRDREHLPDEARRRIAAQVSSKLGVLARRDQAPERHLASQPVLERGSCWTRGGKYVGLSTKFWATAFTGMPWLASSTPTACT